jgi:hypothetical protein
MTRTLAFVAALLLASSPAVAQSPAPTLPPGPALAPPITYTPPPKPSAPAATPAPYTPIACMVLVKRAHVEKQNWSAHAVGAVTEAAFRAHDFDRLFVAAVVARQAAANGARGPQATMLAEKAVLAINTAALAVYRAQADVRGCWGLR